METFGERLNLLRRKKGWSLEYLASFFGVSKSATSSWEIGKSKPNADDLVKLSELLDTTPNYLLLGKVEENKYSELLLKYNAAHEELAQYHRNEIAQLKNVAMADE